MHSPAAVLLKDIQAWSPWLHQHAPGCFMRLCILNLCLIMKEADKGKHLTCQTSKPALMAARIASIIGVGALVIRRGRRMGSLC